MIKFEDGKLFENDREIGIFLDGKLIDGMFSLNEEGFPIERFPEIQIEWDKYPHPEPEPIPVEKGTTFEDYQLEQEFRISKLELGV